MHIAFRVDASSQIGTGHLMRCLALAAQLSSKFSQIHFISLDLPEGFRALIEAQGYLSHALPLGCHDGAWEDDAAGTREILARQPGSIAWLVVDHYRLDARWEKSVSSVVAQLLVIDDLADRPHECDVLLDQNFYHDMDERYKGLVADSTRLFLGPRYALLRQDFANAGRVDRAARSQEPVQAMQVCFGGADPTRETLKVLEALAPIMDQGEIRIEVVVGAACAHLPEIKAATERHACVDLVVNASDLAERMIKADLAIGAAGSMSWERASVGLPSIAIAIADNQRLLGHHAAQAGLHLFLGNHQEVSVTNIRDAVNVALSNADMRYAFAQRSQSICDGRGAARVARIMSLPPINIRPVTLADARDMYEWRNAAVNRRYSHNDQEISWDTHIGWLERSLRNPDRALLIGQDSQGPIGVLRYDRLNGSWMTSVYLVPQRHGSGLGESLLREGLAWLKQRDSGVHEVLAEIRPENHASRDVFLRAGYKPAFMTYVAELT